MIQNKKNSIIYFTFENLSMARVPHCFTTRIGGVSASGYATLNLGLHNGDREDSVRENFARLCDAAGFNAASAVFSNQVHGTNIEEVTAPLRDMQRVIAEADGLITNRAGIALATYYADCVPLLFYDPVRKVVANSHAGWRGASGNIAAKTVQAMRSRFKSNPQDILVGIGPSICATCFEVDIDVTKSFKKSLPFSGNFMYNSPSAQNKFHIDLWQICCESLVLADVPRGNIEVAGICTYEHEELFFSHRRSQGASRGNMLAMISL